MMSRGRILVIAGSDSSGGAGLEADQKVIAAHGCYAMTATTALTAQNTQGVNAINVISPDFVEKQIDACIEDIGVDVVKIGMLASAETVVRVADTLRKHNVTTTVLDPVMVSTTGAQLLPQDAVSELRERLLPFTTVLTPNVPEAKLLLFNAGHEVKDPTCIADLVSIAKGIRELGPEYVLVKGGHLPFKKDGTVAFHEKEKELMVDVLCGNGEVIRIESAYRNSKNTHGTGCSLASAIASNIANGLRISEAVRAACRYVEAGIRTAVELGHGNGPINHFHSTYTLPFAPGRFLEYLLDRSDVQKAWQAHTEHKFVTSLADGTLPLEYFKVYLIQDYLFLFARANALAAYKAKSMEDIVANGYAYPPGNGLTHSLLSRIWSVKGGNGRFKGERRYVLDIGQSEDLFALQISMAPCLIGYGVIARRLYDDPKTKRKGNVYWQWIENYVADDYTTAVKVGSDLLERHAVLQSPSRIEELVKIFVHATNMEAGFWNMSEGR